MAISNYIFSTIKPPSEEEELSVTSGILGRINKWKNESSVRKLYITMFPCVHWVN